MGTTVNSRAGTAFGHGAPVGAAFGIASNTPDDATAKAAGKAFGAENVRVGFAAPLPSGLSNIATTPYPKVKNTFSNPADKRIRAGMDRVYAAGAGVAASPVGITLGNTLTALNWGVEMHGNKVEADIRRQGLDSILPGQASFADRINGSLALVGISPIWDEKWRAGWNATQRAQSTPHQTLWLRLAFLNRDQGDRYDPDNPYLLIDDPSRAEESDQYFGNGWAYLATGVGDIGFNILGDPLIGVGAGISAARSTRNLIRASDVEAARKADIGAATTRAQQESDLNNRLAELDLEDIERPNMNLGPSATAAAEAAADAERATIVDQLANPDPGLAANLTKGGRRIRVTVGRQVEVFERVLAHGIKTGDMAGAYAALSRMKAFHRTADDGAILKFMQEVDKVADPVERIALRREALYAIMGDKNALKSLETKHAKLWLEIRAMSGPNRTTAMAHYLNESGMYDPVQARMLIDSLNDDKFVTSMYEAFKDEIDEVHAALQAEFDAARANKLGLNEGLARVHDVGSPTGMRAAELPDAAPGAAGEVRLLTDTNGLADSWRVPDATRFTNNEMRIHKTLWSNIGLPPLHVITGRHIPNMVKLSGDDSFQSFASVLAKALIVTKSAPLVQAKLRALADRWVTSYGPANPGASRAVRRPIVDEFETIMDEFVLDLHTGRKVNTKGMGLSDAAAAIARHREQLRGILIDAKMRRTAQMSHILERAQQASARGDKDILIQDEGGIYAIPLPARAEKLARPVVESQLEDYVSLLDYKMVDHLFKTQGAGDLAGKMEYIADVGWRATEHFAGFTMDLWRFGVTVLRFPGYPIRTQTDDQLRVLTVLGAEQYGANVWQGIKNIKANHGKITREELLVIIRNANLRARLERLDDQKRFHPENTAAIDRERALLMAEMDEPIPASAYFGDNAPADLLDLEAAQKALRDLDDEVPPPEVKTPADTYMIPFDETPYAPERNVEVFPSAVPWPPGADPRTNLGINFLNQVWSSSEVLGLPPSYFVRMQEVLDILYGPGVMNATEFVASGSQSLADVFRRLAGRAGVVNDPPKLRAFIASKLKALDPSISWERFSAAEMLDTFGVMLARRAGYKAIWIRGDNYSQPIALVLNEEDVIKKLLRQKIAADAKRAKREKLESRIRGEHLDDARKEALAAALDNAAKIAAQEVRKRGTAAQQKIGYGAERGNPNRTVEDMDRSGLDTDAEASVLGNMTIQGHSHLGDLRNQAMIPNGNYNHITAAHPDWLAAYLDYVNKRLRSSKPFTKMMSGASDAEVIKFFEEDPEGILIWAGMAERWPGGIPELVAAQRVQLDLVLPTKELRDHALAGEVDAAAVNKAFPSAMSRPNVPHAILERNPLKDKHKKGPGGVPTYNPLDDLYTTVRGKLYHTLNEVPTEMLARHPFYIARTKMHLNQTLQGMGVDSLTVSQYNQAVKRAKIMARKDVSRYMFDTSNRSNLAHHLQFMTGFYGAWSDTVRKWGLIFGENLHAAPLGIKAFTSFRRNGLVVDSEGNTIEGDGTVVDNDGNVIRVSQDPTEGRIVWATPPWMTEKAQENWGGTGRFSTNLGSLNTIFQGEYPWLPGPSPIVAMAANEVLSRAMPEWFGIGGKLPTWADNNIAKWFLPFGTTQDASYNQFQPPWLRNLITLVRQDQHDNRYAQVWADQLANELAQQHIDPDRPRLNDVELKKLIDTRTKNWFLLTFLGSEAPYSTRPEGRMEFYRKEYQRYLRDFGKDPRDANYESARDKFFDDHPDYAGATVSLNFNETGISPTDQAWEREWKYRKEIDTNKKFGWAWIGAANVGGGFSKGVYTAQAAKDSRVGKDPTQAIHDGYEQLGWFEYQTKIAGPLNLALEARRAQGLSASINANVNADLKRHRDGAIDALKKENEYWAAAYRNGDGGVAAEDFLEYSEKMLDLRPELAKEPEFIRLAEYKEARAFMQEVMIAEGASSMTNQEMDPYRERWENYVMGLVESDIGFEQMYVRGNLDRDELRLDFAQQEIMRQNQ